tara:strand:- start:483 stop:1118 length:636 start_codon:yes stop_codon:yes gene_type:complete
MTTVGHRIYTRRKELKLTQTAVAAMIGVSSASLTYWERDEIEPKNKNMAALARALDCAPDYLLFGATFGGDVSFVTINARVPLIGWDKLSSYIEGEVMEKHGEADDWIYCPVQCAKSTFALRVKGDHMESPYPGKKSYLDGQIIFVDPTAELKNGSRVISRRLDSTEATFKEYFEDDGKKYLKPINPQYPTVEINNETIIIGVVIGSFVAE